MTPIKDKTVIYSVSYVAFSNSSDVMFGNNSLIICNHLHFSRGFFPYISYCFLDLCFLSLGLDEKGSVSAALGLCNFSLKNIYIYRIFADDIADDRFLGCFADKMKPEKFSFFYTG